MALVVKNLPANAGDMREMGYYQPLGRPLEGGMAAGSRILAWRIPWTEESLGSQSDATGHACARAILSIAEHLTAYRSTCFSVCPSQQGPILAQRVPLWVPGT